MQGPSWEEKTISSNGRRKTLSHKRSVLNIEKENKPIWVLDYMNESLWAEILAKVSSDSMLLEVPFEKSEHNFNHGSNVCLFSFRFMVATKLFFKKCVENVTLVQSSLPVLVTPHACDAERR